MGRLHRVGRGTFVGHISLIVLHIDETKFVARGVFGMVESQRCTRVGFKECSDKVVGSACTWCAQAYGCKLSYFWICKKF